MAEQTWYVVIPFASEGSAERAMRQIIDKTGYLASVANAPEDDPPNAELSDAEVNFLRWAQAKDDGVPDGVQ